MVPDTETGTAGNGSPPVGGREFHRPPTDPEEGGDHDVFMDSYRCGSGVMVFRRLRETGWIGLYFFDAYRRPGNIETAIRPWRDR